MVVNYKETIITCITLFANNIEGDRAKKVMHDQIKKLQIPTESMVKSLIAEYMTKNKPDMQKLKQHDFTYLLSLTNTNGQKDDVKQVIALTKRYFPKLKPETQKILWERMLPLFTI
jgi:hypothetical protein